MSKFAFPAARRAAVVSARARLLQGSMLSGTAPLAQASARRRKGFFSVAAPVVATTGVFAFAPALAMAQTMATMTPNDGSGGTITYSTAGSTYTDGTTTPQRRGITIFGSPSPVTFTGLNLNVGRGAALTFQSDNSPLSVMSIGAASTVGSNGDGLDLLAADSVTADLGALTVNANGATAISAAAGNGLLELATSGGTITAAKGIVASATGDIRLSSGSAMTVTSTGINAEATGLLTVANKGAIDGAGSTGIIAGGCDGTLNSFTVTVDAAIGANQNVRVGVDAEAGAGDATTNTVNVNANIGSTGDSIFVGGASAAVDVANGVTVSSTGGHGVNNDGGGALVVNNNGGTITAASQAILSQHDLTVVNKTGGTISSSGSDAVFAFGAANVLNAGTITSTTYSGVVGAAGSVVTNATGGSIQGGADATYGTAVQLSAQSGVVNNYGSLTGTASAISVNSNLGTSTAGVAVNLFAGSTTGAIDFTNAPSATLSLYNGAGTANAGVVDTATGVQLQNAGTLNAATVGTVTGPFDLVLRGAGDGAAANGAAGSYNLASSTGLLSLTKQDSGTWTVSGTSAYTGATTIAAGTLALANGASIASSSNTALTGSTSILDLTAGTTAQTISTLSGVAGSQVKVNGKGLTINQAANAVFAGNLSGTQNFIGGLSKTGAGTLTLTGANTYSGPVTISQGVLALSSAGSLANASIADAATFDISGHAGGTSIVSLSGAGATTLGANTLTLSNASGTVSGVISGAGGGLTVAAGTETLTGANSYTGATTIGAGATLALSGAGSIANSSSLTDVGAFDVSNVTGGSTALKALKGSGSVVLGANTLNLTGRNTNFSGVISGSGGVTIANDFAILTGANTYTGATTLNGTSVLQLGASGGTGSVAGPIVLNGASVLVISRNNADTLASTISGTGQLQLGGTGVTTITAADTYTDRTFIAQGTLALSGAGSIAASSTVLNNSVFDISGVTGATASVKSVSGSAAGIVNLGAETLVITAGGATFASAANGTGGLTFAAGNSGLTSVNTYTGATTVNAGANLFLNAASSIAASSGVVANGRFDIAAHTGGVTLNSLSGANTGTVTLGANTLTLANASATFAGVVSGAGGGLTVAGGTENLTGANTYTGATAIGAGATLALTGAGDISYSSGVAANGTLDVSGVGAVNSRYTLIQGLTGAAAGRVTLGTTYLEVSTPLNFAGVISGTGSLQIDNGPPSQQGVFAFNNAGVSTLTADNTFTGLTIFAGTLNLGAGGTTGSLAGKINISSTQGSLNINRSNGLTLGQVISGTGGLQQLGAGTTTITAADTYTGATTITAGTLALSDAGSIVGSAVIDNATFDISGHTGGATIAGLSGAGNVTLGANTLTLNGGGTFAGVASGTGGLTIAAGDEVLTGNNTYTGTTTVSGGNLALGAGGTTGSVAGPTSLASGVLTINRSNAVSLATISGGGSLVQAGGGVTTLTGVNGYTGSTTINAGTLALTGAGDISASSGVIDNGVFDISGGSSGGSTIANLTGSGAVQLGGATLTVANASGVFSGGIAGSGGLTVAGGVQTLSGANAYTGATTLAGGSLTLGAGGSLASSVVNLTSAGSVFDATALPSLTLADLSGVAGSTVAATGLVTLGSANSTTFAGALTSTGGLAKVGSGTLSLTGANGFSGPVTINAGVLAVSGGSAIPDASVVTVASGAGFQVLSNETVANIAGAGAIGLSSAAALTFGGDNQSSSFGAFVGAGNLIKTGTGTFTLAGANSSTGATTVSAGVLQLGTGARIAGAVNVASGASLTGSGSVGALTVAAGATLSPGVAAGDFGTINAASLNTAGTIRIDFGGNSTGSKSDKIVVSGAINVAGGAIDAHPTSATNDYTFNQYFALTAGTTFTGQFTNSTDFTANPYDPRLKQRIRYDLGPTAVLEVRFLQDLTAGVPTTGGGNVGSVAAALNGTEQGASDSFSVLINALADQNPAARTASLQLLSGEGAVDGQELVAAGLGAFTGVLGSHLADAAGDSLGSASAFGLFDAQGGGSSRLSTLRAMQNDTVVGLGVGVGPNVGRAPLGLRVWGQGFAVDHHTDSNAGFASTTTSGEGFAAGVDAGLGHGVTVGAAVGYSNPQSKTSGRLAKANGDSTFGGVYARYTMGPWFGGASFAYGSTSLDLQRSVIVGPLTFNPHGRTDADSYGAGFLAGYRFSLRDGSRIDPMVTLDYGHTGEDAYSETNGGVAGLRYDSVDLDEVIGTVGARWSKDFQVHGWKVTPDARLAAALAGGDLGIDTGATFLAAPVGTGSFRTLGAKTPPNWGVFGVGVALHPLGSAFDVKLGYEGNYASRFTDHHIAATVGYRF